MLLYIVGSATRENRFKENSDVDFHYRFRKEDIDLNNYADNYFDRLFYLKDLINKKVDLVVEEKIWNLCFIESINWHKKMIYES